MKLDLASELARCDREIAEMEQRAEAEPMPAWLVTLGIEDWEAEKRMLLRIYAGQYRRTGNELRAAVEQAVSPAPGELST